MTICQQLLKTWCINAIPSNFAILSVCFLLIEKNKGLMFNVYMPYLALLSVAELRWAGGRMSHLF